MIPFSVDYEFALDFEHCNSMDEAVKKLSQLTNLLNKVISIRHYARSHILDECSKYPEEKMQKLSWENKLVSLKIVSKRDDLIIDLIDLYDRSDEAYIKLKLKHEQVVEDLMKLKKQADITPR